MKVYLTESAAELLSLDETDSAKNRGLTLQQLYTRRGRANGYYVEADRIHMEKLLEEFEDIASGLMCDGVDNPGVSKRVGKTAAAAVRAVLDTQRCLHRVKRGAPYARCSDDLDCPLIAQVLGKE